MANGEDLTDLQAVDFALGGVIAGAYEGLLTRAPRPFVDSWHARSKKKSTSCKMMTSRRCCAKLPVERMSPGGRCQICH